MIRILTLMSICLLTFYSASGSGNESNRSVERLKMVEVQIKGRGVQHAAVLKSMREVPRHLFVEPRYSQFAYHDRPLPIRAHQTISQPYIVALMTELIDPNSNHVVLEVGTGSGYQAAVLSGIVKHVFTIEIIEDLCHSADLRLEELGYQNVTVRCADGYLGWTEKAPFDAIVVTAAASEVPPPLIEQLKPNGRLVIPIDSVLGGQDLLVITKQEDGSLMKKKILPVRFVPLTRV